MKNLNIYRDKVDSNIKIVELNKPEIKNAFNPDMIQELTTAFTDLSKDKSIKLIVLKGSGSVFCAGADLNWMKSMVNFSFEENVKDSKKLWDMFEAIAFCEVPVVGIAHGAAFGGALGLLACCDQVISLPSTKFCFSEVKLGLSPAVISAFILRKCADAFVRPFMLNAEVFNPEIALRIGLVHSLAADIDQAMTEVRKYSALGTQAIRETKKLLNAIEQSKHDKSWLLQKELTTKVISERRISVEGQERLKAFLK